MSVSDEPHISKWLHPEEEPLWSGRPLPDVRQEVSHILLLCISGISVIALRYGLGSAFLFVFACIVGIVGTIFDEINRRKTCYALTDRRAIIIKTGNPGSVRSLPLDAFDVLHISPGRNDKGTIQGRSTARDWSHRDQSGKPVTGSLFRHIDSAEHVYALMVESRPDLAETAQPEVEPAHERQIRAWLLTGETLLWSGRPRLKSEKDLMWRDALSLLLIAMYIVIAFGIVHEAWETREPRYEGVGAVSDLTLAILIAGAAAFVLFGIYGGFLHHVVDRYRWNTTFYGLTDQRTIVETARSVRFVPLASIISIDVECDDSGRGTIGCRSDVIEGLNFWRFSPFLRKRSFNGLLFRDILDPEHVRALMADARAALAGRS